LSIDSKPDELARKDYFLRLFYIKLVLFSNGFCVNVLLYQIIFQTFPCSRFLLQLGALWRCDIRATYVAIYLVPHGSSTSIGRPQATADNSTLSLRFARATYLAKARCAGRNVYTDNVFRERHCAS
jgi:hypothetical protein